MSCEELAMKITKKKYRKVEGAFYVGMLKLRDDDGPTDKKLVFHSIEKELLLKCQSPELLTAMARRCYISLQASFQLDGPVRRRFMVYAMVDGNYVIDWRKVTMLRWQWPEDNDGRGRFLAVSRWCENTHDGEFEVDEQWVFSQFGRYKGWLDQVKNRTDNAFTRAPTGRKRTLVDNRRDGTVAPLVHYHSDTSDLDCCVMHCLASAFQYVGDEVSAVLVAAFGQDFQHRHESRKEHIIEETGSFLMKNTLWRTRRLEKECNIIREALRAPSDAVLLCQLLSTDGAAEHAIAIVNGWLFDFNFMYAERLSMNALDGCCGDSKFSSVLMGYYIWRVPAGRSKKHRSKRRKREK